MIPGQNTLQSVRFSEIFRLKKMRLRNKAGKQVTTCEGPARKRFKFFTFGHFHVMGSAF